MFKKLIIETMLNNIVGQQRTGPEEFINDMISNGFNKYLVSETFSHRKINKQFILEVSKWEGSARVMLDIG